MNNLKKLRIEKNITLRKLSEQVQIDYTALSRIENGNRNLNDNDIQVLTKYFNVSADYLLGLSTERKVPSPSKVIISPKDQLKGIKLALYDQVEDLTDDQAQQVLDIIKIIKKDQK